LGLATPTAIVTAVGSAARKGILIKDAEAIERLGSVTDLILDKTGTITEGKPIVQTAIFAAHVSELDQSIFHEMESRSEHPLAHAVVQYFKDNAIETRALDQFESITARGVKASFNGDTYLIGSHLLVQEINANAAEKFVKQLNDAGQTTIYFIKNDSVVGIMAIDDAIKENSIQAIRELQRIGITIHMLTGDGEATAKRIANSVGIKIVKFNCSPADKGAYVRDLQSKQKVVGMVGDGINDSEALAQSDVSIAMGRGADVAKDVAKITLLSSDLLLIPKAFSLSKKTSRVIRQNLFWAFVYNVLGIPIAAGILIPFTGFMLNPMIAGAAMALSSVSVVTNSLRLRIFK
jgi:Cu2+-exporting ATPase